MKMFSHLIAFTVALSILVPSPAHSTASVSSSSSADTIVGSPKYPNQASSAAIAVNVPQMKKLDLYRPPPIQTKNLVPGVRMISEKNDPLPLSSLKIQKKKNGRNQTLKTNSVRVGSTKESDRPVRNYERPTHSSNMRKNRIQASTSVKKWVPIG